MITGNTRRMVLDLYLSEAPIKEIENRANVTSWQIYRILDSAGIERTRKRGKKHKNEYAVYDSKDNFLVCGTCDECAAYLGIKRNSFYRKLNRQKSGQPQRIYIVELSSEE